MFYSSAGINVKEAPNVSYFKMYSNMYVSHRGFCGRRKSETQNIQNKIPIIIQFVDIKLVTHHGPNVSNNRTCLGITMPQYTTIQTNAPHSPRLIPLSDHQNE